MEEYVFMSSLRLGEQQVWGFSIRSWGCFPRFSRWSTAVATWRSASTCWTCPCTTPATKSLGWWPWVSRCLPVPSLRSSSTATCLCSGPVWIWSWYSSIPGEQLFHPQPWVLARAAAPPERVKTSVEKTEQCKIDLELGAFKAFQAAAQTRLCLECQGMRACPI